MKIGVIGASGYSGGELLRLLLKHPSFTLEYIAAGTQAGSLITDIHPQLIPLGGQKFEATEVTRMNQCDLLFFALPHGESAKLISKINPDIKVVDLGADFRLASADSWQKYYGGVHAGTWVYGLPEIPGQRKKIAGAQQIANPGCYATVIALAAAPALANELIEADDIVVVAASGTTGAGRKASNYLLASEVMGSLSSYKFGGIHQHTPEIEETLTSVAGTSAKISFTPVLAPMPRGILATVTARLTKSLYTIEIQKLYQEFFAAEEFVTGLSGTSLPHTSATIGSNSTLMQVAVDTHTNRLIISAALDNLGKGAASQAIQNANIISGLPENAGLTSIGIGT